MKLLKIIVFVAIIGGGYQMWNGQQNSDWYEVEEINGFVPILAPEGVRDNIVVIYTPKNCPKESAQRAYELSEQLTELGIPNVQKSRFRITAKADQRAEMNRSAAVLRGGIPAVYINGLAKADPSLEDTVAAYKSTKW